MIRHFFLDKTNTIIENCDLNFSLNPILSLCYGKGIMRGLIHFDMDQIKQLIDDKTFSNLKISSVECDPKWLCKFNKGYLRKVSIQYWVTRIEKHHLQGLNLDSITIPSSVTWIDSDILSCCTIRNFNGHFKWSYLFRFL